MLHANTREGAASAHEALTCINTALRRLSNQSLSLSLSAPFAGDGCFAFRDALPSAAEAVKHTGDFIDFLKELRARVVRGPFGKYSA